MEHEGLAEEKTEWGTSVAVSVQRGEAVDWETGLPRGRGKYRNCNTGDERFIFQPSIVPMTVVIIIGL